MSGGIGDAMGGTGLAEGRHASRFSSARRDAEWRAQDEASETWRDAQDLGARALSRMEHSAEDAFYATRRFVYQHPMQALIGVTALAFAVGALWRLGARDRGLGEDFLHRVSDYVDPQVQAMRRRW